MTPFARGEGIITDEGDVNDVLRVTREIASGNTEAFARFYREKFEFVLRVARRTTRLDEDTCLDIVQDAMMRVIRYMKPFDDARAVDRWLTRVTRTVAYDHLRKERRRRMRERVAVDARARAVRSDTDDIDERVERVRREFGGLDRVSVEIIELRFRTGMTLAAIGRLLGISVGSVHGRLVRAVARLRKRTEEASDE